MANFIVSGGGNTYHVIQLVLVLSLVAAIYMSTAAAAQPLDTSRKALFFDKKTTYSWPSPPREASCTSNKTICLDPKLNANGPTCCSSKCVDIKTDLYNCGGCSRACAKGYTCCNKECVNTLSNPSHCGSCGHKCSKNSRGKIGECLRGFCGYNGYY